MFYQSTKTYGHDLGLSACYRQWRATSHCRFLHGYALSFKITFGAKWLDENGWVMDFGGLSAIKAYLVRVFDHKLLLARSDPMLERLTQLQSLGIVQCEMVDEVGCEAFAKMVYDFTMRQLVDDHKLLAGRVFVQSVECAEHGANSSVFQGDY